MAEGSYRMEPEGYSVEDMDEGSDEVEEEEMVEGNDYEEFGAFGGYGALTSFDIRILRAFGSLGPGFRILAVRPLVGPLLALGLLPCDFREDGRRGVAEGWGWGGVGEGRGGGGGGGMGKNSPASPNLPSCAGGKGLWRVWGLVGGWPLGGAGAAQSECA